ncbi:MAG: hypothetical protein AB7G28_23550 [Pirellulales bacterium]
MTTRVALRNVLSAYLALAAVSAWGANPVSWKVALSTTGNDVFWTSPTAIDLGYPEYDWSFEITKLNANVFILGDRDLLSSLESTSGSGTSGELPISLYDDLISEPITGSNAHIKIEVDSQGFGRGSGTDITLGSILGLPIRRVDFEATINVRGIPTGDYDRNGVVAAADYTLWESTLGSPTELRADGNHNGVVDAADFTIWRDNYASGGGAGSDSAVAGSAIPEPAPFPLVVCCLIVAVSAARNRGPKIVQNS